MSQITTDGEEGRDRMQQEDAQKHPPTDRGNTVRAQGETQRPKAQIPAERDESAHSQSADNESARRMGAIAHESVEEGQQDTSKAQETDATYHRMREGAAPAPRDKVDKNQR